MVRACCVPGCNSGVNVPSHKFPKNPERCSEWIKSLNMQHLENYCANDLQKFKICYKHFCEQDYNYSLHNRILSSIAVPVLFVTDSSADTITNNLQQKHLLQKEENIKQHKQILHPVGNQNVLANEIIHLELTAQQSKPLLQQKDLIRKYNTQQANFQNRMLQQQQKININIQDHENRLQKAEEYLTILTTCSKPSTRQRRSKSREKISKTTLTSIYTKLHEINIKLRRQNRYLTRLLKYRKVQSKHTHTKNNIGTHNI